MSSSLFTGLSWRQIGPFRGGRLAAVTGVPSAPETYYIGAALGGVWKTTDGGNRWTPIFDHASPLASIGAIAVSASNPDVIYVGTGESAPREDASFGDGIWKSTDGGRTWVHVGLEDSQHIARIMIDPQNPDLVLVAAQGHIYGPNEERGVFRSTDGGRSWTKVLYKDALSGAIELAADPDNPTTVFAALWQVQRQPWHLESGGPGSGLYKSTDEGATWTPVTGHGLPETVLGKIGISVAAGTRGRRVYALVEAAQGGLFRSDDGGATWTRTSDSHPLYTRAWYFTKVFAHPTNPDVVYVVGNTLWRSADGGRTFARLTIPGADNHDLWINPRNPSRIIEGNDQGVILSVNGGATWDKRDNLPIGQFYHVSTDTEFPYHLFGGQQDMGALGIATRGWGGIDDKDWFDVGGDDAECGWVWPVPFDNHLIIAGGYNGALTLFDTRSHQIRDIAPWSNASGGHPAADLKYRFTWTSPAVFSPTDPHVLYMGSQYLMESRDLGHSWKVVSPDLTRNDPAKQRSSGGPLTQDNASVEYYDVIFSIAPSPLISGLIWVGTDDGVVQLSSDAGAHWTKVTPPGLKEWAKVSLVEASHFDADTAYVAVDAHKLDDLTPYIYRTHDRGRTWTLITEGLHAPSHVYAVREDPKRKGLLFAGTETGIFVSFDDGDHWQSLQLNLPPTSVRDIAFHDDDLAVATHGRSFWILDDITPLRAASMEIAEAPAHLFTPARAVRVHERETYVIPVDGVGANPDAAIVNYVVGAAGATTVRLDIVDGAGRTAFSASSGAQSSPRLALTPGMHRVAWNLRYPLPDLIPGTAYNERDPRGVLAVPGQYTVKLTVDGRVVSAPLTVVKDPRSSATQEEMAAEFDLATQLMGMLGELHTVVRQIQAVRAQVDSVSTRAARSDAAPRLQQLDKAANDVLNRLYEPEARSSSDMLNFPMRLNVRLAYLEDEVDYGDGAPTEQFRQMTSEYRGVLDAEKARWKAIVTTDIPAINRQLAAIGAPQIVIR
ncbi:MAG TPA: hypothetical protein VNR64_10760 [Vicinamibacterales bacterium]|nr:hypothetical protein [Vicinamibacterales bacterium]